MEKLKSPKGFIVVLPGEIIEIPQDSDKSWLTLFYSLPRELAEKWKPAYDLPRCPYEVLRTDKYDHIVCDDMFKLLVWDCYAWSAWQFFQVKDRKGNYRDIPGKWTQYAGYFPLWRLSYSIIPYIRMKFEQNGLGFQNLYNIPQGVEVPWLTYQQFKAIVKDILEVEAPLSEDLFLKRIVWYFDREKVTSVVQRAYEQQMYGYQRYGIIRRNGFLYLDNGKEVQFRGPGDIERDIKQIAPEELAAGMLEILKQNVTADKAGLYRSLAAQCGVARVGKAVNEAMDTALHILEDRIIVDGEQISLK